MAKSFKLGAETVFNLVLVVLGLFIIYESFHLGFGTLKRPGSGFFVILCGILISGLSSVSLIKQSESKIRSLFHDDERKKFLLIIIPFLAWILLIDILGYVLVTFLCTFSLSKLLKLPGWWRPLVLSLSTALLCYVVFDYILTSDLPRGFLK
jgi:putative tricarboxylic transport membrane protein